MELIDIGCNLTHDSFDRDREAVIKAAHEAGVVQMIVTGASAEGSVEAVKLAISAIFLRAMPSAPLSNARSR